MLVIDFHDDSAAAISRPPPLVRTVAEIFTDMLQTSLLPENRGLPRLRAGYSRLRRAWVLHWPDETLCVAQLRAALGLVARESCVEADWLQTTYRSLELWAAPGCERWLQDGRRTVEIELASSLLLQGDIRSASCLDDALLDMEPGLVEVQVRRRLWNVTPVVIRWLYAIQIAGNIV
jgi:hypothetical protein